MKNKILLIGSLCLIMACGLVISGCPNEVQNAQYGSVGAPKNVAATYVAEVTSGANPKPAHIKVTWDVNPDAGGYDVVYVQDGKKDWDAFLPWGGGYLEYPGFELTTTGSIVDQDKWYAEVYASAFPKGTFKIGVIAGSRRYDKKSSKPAWAPTTVTIP